MAKNILISLSLLFMFSCGDNNDSLKYMIININKKCPIEEKYWTVDSLGISNNGEIVYFCNTDKNAEYFDLLKSKKDSITKSIIDNLNNSKIENSMKLVKLCKKYDSGLVYKYASNKTNEKVVLKIPASKLIVDPEKD